MGLRFEMKPDEIIRIEFALKIQGEFPDLKVGMKVKASYLLPPVWLYGVVTTVSSNRRFVSVDVKRSNLAFLKKRRKGNDCNLCFDHLTGWVEAYDY